MNEAINFATRFKILKTALLTKIIIMALLVQLRHFHGEEMSINVSNSSMCML
jgi:hypothetical protein